MDQDDLPLPGEPVNDPLPEADALLLAQLREGDVEAGHRFVRDYYPGIYRYLLYLTGHRKTAEDLTQETFLQAWSHLDQFQGRAPLPLWLHTIARRVFLQAKRRQRAVGSLDEVAELAAPRGDVWTEDAELRVLLGALPEEQREVMALHFLGGDSSSEIARIVQALARLKTAPPEEKKQREEIADNPGAWAPLQMYFWLAPGEMAAVRAGPRLFYQPAVGPATGWSAPSLPSSRLPLYPLAIDVPDDCHRRLSFGRTFAADTVAGSRKQSPLPILRMAAPSQFAGALLRRRAEEAGEAGVERN